MGAATPTAPRSRRRAATGPWPCGPRDARRGGSSPSRCSSSLWELIGRSGLTVAIVPPSEVLPGPLGRDHPGRPHRGNVRDPEHRGGRLRDLGRDRRSRSACSSGCRGPGRRVRPDRERVLLGADHDVHPGDLRLPRARVQGEGRPGRVLFAIFVIIVNTATGIREVPPSVIEMARAFGTSNRTSTARSSSLGEPVHHHRPRIGAARAVQGAILADLFFRTQNLGLVIRNAAGSFRLSTLLGAVFFITIIAAGTMGLARIVEWRLLRWKTNRETSARANVERGDRKGGRAGAMGDHRGPRVNRGDRGRRGGGST